MLKRKVSAIWILILAVITAAACIFATVIYIRYGRQTPNKARELGQFRFLKAESDSAGVSFEVINIREVGSDVVLDLRWINSSGNPIAYGEAYELYRLKDGKWEKIDTKLFFPDICYCINSGSVGRISYTIPGHIDMTEGERYRLQTEFRFQYGDGYFEPLKNRLEFEIVKKTTIGVPPLKINILTTLGGAHEFETSLCLGTRTTTENNSNNTVVSMQFCGPDIGKESGLPEITTESAASRSDRKASRLLLFFDTLPDNVTIKCMPKEGGNIRQIADIERDYMHYSFQLLEGSYIYRVIAEWNNGNRRFCTPIISHAAKGI